MLTDPLASYALEPIRRERIYERTRGILRANYPIIKAWAKKHLGDLSHVPPKAGAIAWFGIRGGADTNNMAEELRARHGGLIVPGEQTGMQGHFRVGCGGNPPTIERALERVDQVLARAVVA